MRLVIESEGQAPELNGRPSGSPEDDCAATEFGNAAASPIASDAGAAVVPAETHQPVASHRPASHHRHGMLQSLQSLLYVIVIALFIITFIVQPFRIPTESMVPTLLVGDFLLVDKQVGIEVPPWGFAPTSSIHRGDLIVFRYPVDPSMDLVKRVVGRPGDHVRLRDGHAYIDGRALSEPYTIRVPAEPDSYRDDFPMLASADPGVDSRWWIQMHALVSNGELTVPPDSYFVLGDNRNNSEDSRYWGFVPQADIVGKPILIYFSLNHPGPTPGQSLAGAMPGAGKDDATHSAPSGFARWDRALRVIR
jgi:signal peptidase I